MRWCGVGAVVILFCSVMVAQVAVPAQGQIVVSGPLVSPPFVDLGNGINPPVITNPTNIIISAPGTAERQTVVGANASAAGATAGGVTGAAAQNENGVRQTARFDYVVAPRTGGIGMPVFGSDTRSLGEVAAATRHRGVGQPGHVYTNDDLARLNGGMAGSEATSQENTTTEQAQNAPSGQVQAPPAPAHKGAMRSPFAPPPGAMGGVTQAMQGAASGSNRPASAEPSNMGAAQRQGAQQGGVATQNADQQQQKQLPPTSSVLPLITLAGAMLAGVGAVYWKLR